MATTQRLITLAGGRALDIFVVVGRPRGGQSSRHPQEHRILPSLEEAAPVAGVRIGSLALPGYAESTRLPGRTVADVVPDVLAMADVLGV